MERDARRQLKLPYGKNGGSPIEHLKEIIIEDIIGIYDKLDRRAQNIFASYHYEWTEVAKDPARHTKFKKFVNIEETISRNENNPVDESTEVADGEHQQEIAEGAISLSVEYQWNRGVLLQYCFTNLNFL